MKNGELDFTGARGSNAGDVFHELWTVREALRLLLTEDDLRSIEVEGVRSTSSSDNEWEGVDCALFFGGEDLKSAARIELQQLKYSSAHPTTNWTVSRISSNDSRPKGHGSVIRKIADAYKQAKLARPDLDAENLRVSLITNQPISKELLALIEGARSSVPQFRGVWSTGKPKLHRLVEASGLSSVEFMEFAKSFEIGSKSGSRFGLEEEVLGEIAKWADTEFSEIALRLRKYVRELMLPEETGRSITRESVLLQFGVSEELAILPCPPRLSFPKESIRRSLVDDLVAAMQAGEQYLCLHGAGGVGKTTILEQLSRQLPEQSALVIYDCYGAGTYLDASTLRHRPSDGFLHLSNELALRLRLPALLEPKANRDFARAFRSRLSTASSVLSVRDPNALLVVVIDAADNSIHAAAVQEPPQSSFVREIASFIDLPENVRLLLSTRTGRLETLNLPSSFTSFELKPFSKEETRRFVSGKWDAPADWIDDFHHLSGGVARVQNYAFQQVGHDFAQALQYLRPNGKTLNEVFALQFQEAIHKAGSKLPVERVCAALISLPRPIPIDVAARVLGSSHAVIEDLCNDLAPGVRNQNGLLGFADEDFESFVRERAQPQIQRVTSEAAKLLHDESETSQYGALHVAQLLLNAGMTSELLDLVESSPRPSEAVISDPIRRQETYAQRLLCALRACREAGDTVRALRFVLIGAEGRNTEDSTRDLLIRFPRLAARYARESSGRMILGDPDLVEHHGPHLLQRLTVDAEAGDRVGLRETRRQVSAWFDLRYQNYRGQREEHNHPTAWEVSDSDFASGAVARALDEGVDSVISLLSNQRSFGFRCRVSMLVADRLLAQQRVDLIKDATERLPAWLSVYPNVRLASLGHDIDLNRLAFGLKQLIRRWPPNEFLQRSYVYGRREINAEYIKLQLDAAEILVISGEHIETARQVFSNFTRKEIRRSDKLYTGDTSKIDAILRSMSVIHMLDEIALDHKGVLVKPTEEGNGARKAGHDTHRDREIWDLIGTLFPYYQRRAEIITGKASTSQNDRSPSVGDSWRFDHKYEFSQYRMLLADGLIILGAAGLDARKLLKWIIETAKGLRPGNQEIRAAIVQKLAANADLHEHLLSALVAEANAEYLERVGAEEKSYSLANTAESLIPLSPSDADAVFQLAVEAAAHLDSEVGDQIRLLEALVSRSAHAFGGSRRAYAFRAAEVVTDAGIRVGRNDGFPWSSALSMLEELDLPTALASVARWQDEDIARLSDTLEPVIVSAVRAGRMTVPQAAALLVMEESPELESFEVMLEAASPGHEQCSLADELARDVVGERIPNYGALDPFIRSHGRSRWAKRYVEQRDFEGTLPAVQRESSSPPIPTPDKPRWDPSTINWTRAELTDADCLATAAERALQALRDVEQYGSLEFIICEARKHVGVGDRVAFLEALKSIALRDDHLSLISTVIETSELWNSPAVARWRKRAFREMFAEDIGAFCGKRYWGPERLRKSIRLSGLSGLELQSTLLEGIERSADLLDAGRMLELAQTIAAELTETETAELARWYIDRLYDRVVSEVSEHELENINESDLPASGSEAVARFLAAYMSDVDLRLRWRAAHAMRRLARFQDNMTLDLLIQRYDSFEDPAYRTKGAPYYWLATRLWILTACDRISDESPELIAPHFGFLLAIATDADFPHLLVRDYAANACRKLIASRCVEPSESDLSLLEAVNRFRPSTGKTAQTSSGSGPGYERENERLRFDPMVTVPYWFEPWTRAFEDVSMDDFTKVAEKWIIDRWGAELEESFKSYIPVERRKHRYRSPFGRLTDNRHGDEPTVENYRLHLEWHAMWCTAGELAQTHGSATKSDDGWDEVVWRLSYGRPTHPPYWLSDFCGPPPRQLHHYRAGSTSLDEWTDSISDEEMIRELLPTDCPGWVVVDAAITVRSDKWQCRTGVTSSLVMPSKAGALVRALQLTPNSHDFYLPPERDDRLISSPPYELVGWLSDHDGDRRFDKNDPLRHESDRLRRSPGTLVTKQFCLDRHLDGGLVWRSKNCAEEAFKLETWGRTRENEWGRAHYLGDSVVSDGYRLIARKDILSEFLSAETKELIVELEIEKRGKRRTRKSDLEEGSSEAVYDRVILLRRDGVIEAAECNLGAWKEDCS